MNKVKPGLGDATDPYRELGAVEMSFGSNETTTGLLLLPPKNIGQYLTKRRDQAASLGSPAAKLKFVTATAKEDTVSPDGLRNEYVALDKFEADAKGDKITFLGAGGVQSNVADLDFTQLVPGGR